MAKSKREKIEKNKLEAEKCRRSMHITALLKEHQYNRATLEIESFAKDYPKDNLGKYYYAKVLRWEGKSKEALNLLETLNSETEININMDLIKCYIEIEDYEKTLMTCQRLLKIVENYHDEKYNDVLKFIKRVKIYAAGRLGFIPKNLEDFSPIERQLFDYKEEDAISYTLAYTKGINPDINIAELFQKVKKFLPNEKSSPNAVWQTDGYFFRYSGLGTLHEEPANYLKVVTIHNTNDILMMLALSSIEEHEKQYLSDALITMSKEDDEKDVWQPSRVDKFYQKYKKFMN